MKVTKRVWGVLILGFAWGILAQAQTPDAALVQELERAIENEEITVIHTSTRLAAEINFLGPIVDNVARGVVSLSDPLANVSHMELMVVQPGGAVAHKTLFESEGRWGSKFEAYKFGIELETVGIQEGARLVVDLYQGGQAVAHGEKVLPEQETRPVYVVEDFKVDASGDSLALSYTFTNAAIQGLTVVPQITVTNQNIDEGAILQQKYLPAVQVGPKTKKALNHSLPKPSEPGTYEVVIWLLNEKRELVTGALRQVFVIDGAFGVFQSARLYKDPNTKEDRLLVKGVVSPNVKDEVTLVVLGEPKVQGVTGKQILNEKQIVEILPGQRVEVDLPVNLSKAVGGEMVGYVQMLKDDKLMAEKKFEFKVSSPETPINNVAGETGSPSNPVNDREEVEAPGFSIGPWGWVGGIALVVVLAIIIWWSRRRRPPTQFLLLLAGLWFGATASAQSVDLVNTWYYPQPEWVYNPLAVGDFEKFRLTRFDGSVFNPLTQEGFFQVDPEAIMVRFINGPDYRYSQAFTFDITDNKRYQFDIPVPSDLSEAPWEIELYIKYEGSWYISVWEDEVTGDNFSIEMDKTDPSLAQFTYDGVAYDPSEQLLQPGLETMQDEEVALLLARKAHFLDKKANEIQRDQKRQLRKQKIFERNHLIDLLAKEELAEDNQDAGGEGTADPAAIVSQINVLSDQINVLSRDTGLTVSSSELFPTGDLQYSDLITGVDLAPATNTPFTCAKDVSSTNVDTSQNTFVGCVNYFQSQVDALNPQIAAKRSELRTAKARFKNAAIGVEFICNDSVSGCNPTCNAADEQCDINCTAYPLSCSQYQSVNPAGYAANCSGTPLVCDVDCTVNPNVCMMRGLVADVRGNFCDDANYCDESATRKFAACDNVGNCIDVSNEAVSTDWYDPVRPNLNTMRITRNKNNIGGTETSLVMQTTTGGVIIPNCNTLPSGFSGGDGSAGNPFRICNLAQLNNIRNDVTANYQLTTNIDASPSSGWNGGLGWDPVNNFSGVFDGQGFVIKDLFINRPTTNNVGLFRRVVAGGDVTDVAVVNASVTGQDRVGALVGFWENAAATSVITNVYSSGAVNGRAQVGGLIGGFHSDGATLTNAHSSANVIGDSQVGGLMGWFTDNNGNDAGNIKRVYATGSVNGTLEVGGLIGSAEINTLDAYLLENAYAQNDVSGTDLVGGIFGLATATVGSPVIEDVYHSGIITGTTNVAGIANTSLTINQSYFMATDAFNVGLTADGGAGAITNNVYSFVPALLQAQSSSNNQEQPYYGWDNGVWNFGTVNEYPALLVSVEYNETIAGSSGTLAAADRFSIDIEAADVVNPTAVQYPALFDNNACGSSSVTGFFLANEGDEACSQRYTSCALSSTLRGTKDQLLGTACSAECPTVTYEVDGQTVTETYDRQGDLCVPKCDFRLFDGCFPFLLIGETCENVTWLPLETTVDEGVVFTQTSNCGDTRNWVGTKPITQSIKHFLDGKDVFGVYFYDTFSDGPGFTDMAYRGQFTVNTDGFAEISQGGVSGAWTHEEGYSPNGGKVLKLETTSALGGYVAWERTGIPVSPSTDYILTYWVKTNATTNRNNDGAWPVVLENGSSNLSSQYGNTMTSVAEDLTWYKVEIPITTGPGASTVDIQLRLQGQNDKVAYFDDVVLMEENWRFDSTASWYNETKGDAGDGICDYITGDGDGDPRGGTDVRCGKDYFPEKSVVAFTSDGIWLLDAIDGIMWMSSLEDPFGGWRFVFSTLLSGEPFASNGKLMAGFRFDQGGGRNGAVVIGDFINDTMYSHRMSNCFTLSGYKGIGSGYSEPWCTWGTQRARNWSGFVNDPLTNRNINRNPWTTVMPPNIALANHQINAMHSNIVAGKEYVVIAHDFAGITILNKTDDTVQYLEFDGDVHNDPAYPEWDDLPSNANDYRDVYLANDGRLYYIWDYYNDTKTRLHVLDDITTLPFNGSVLNGNSTFDQRIQPNNAASSYPTTALNDTAAALDVKDDRILIGGDTGFERFSGSLSGGSQHPNLAKQRVNRSFASAPLFGDVQGHWVNGVQDVSGKANDLENMNGVTMSVTNLGSDLQQYNFNDNAYLRSGAGDFTPGSAITFGAWVYTDGLDDGGYIIAQKDVVDTEYGLYRTPDNKLRVEGATSHTVDAYTLNGWNFVVASFDGTTKRAYIDGVKVLEVADVIGTASGGTAMDPSNITFLNEYQDNNGSDNINGATAVELVGNYAYVTANNGDAMQIFDVSNPANITRVGGLQSSAYLDRAYDVAVSGNYAYVASFQDDLLSVIDVSNPASPSHVASEQDSSNLNGMIAVDVQGNYAYTANRNDDSMAVIDISNPSNPTWVGEYRSPSNIDQPYDVKVVGNYAYVAASASDALAIIDISNPVSPVYMGRYQSGSNLNGPQSVEVVGNYAYVACYNGGSMTVIDVSNPSNPTYAGQVQSNSRLNGARGITVDGDYAFVASYQGDSVQIIDITSPSSPQFVGQYNNSNFTNGAMDVRVNGDKIFLANFVDDSLVTLDIGETVSALRMHIGAGEAGGDSTSLLSGAMALPFMSDGAYSDQNVMDLYNGTRDWFSPDTLVTLQGTSDAVVSVKFGDYGSYFVATNGGGITQFDYSGRVVRTISANPTSETNVQIVTNNINAMDYRNGWLIIGYQGRGVEIVNIAPEVSEMLSEFDDAEFDPYFFY